MLVLCGARHLSLSHSSYRKLEDFLFLAFALTLSLSRLASHIQQTHPCSLYLRCCFCAAHIEDVENAHLKKISHFVLSSCSTLVVPFHRTTEMRDASEKREKREVEMTMARRRVFFASTERKIVVGH